MSDKSRKIFATIIVLTMQSLYSSGLPNAYSYCVPSSSDHGGMDWIVTSNQELCGVHTNVGRFIVQAGISASVNIWPGFTPYFEVYAGTITIDGSIVGVPANAAGSGQGEYTAGAVGGGGGGSYGGTGGNGGNSLGIHGSGGLVYGSSGLDTPPLSSDDIQPGSRGGYGQNGNDDTRGWAGVKIFLSAKYGMSISGTVSANGGNGGNVRSGLNYASGSGGGSGGGILLEADNLSVTGAISARAGNGGNYFAACVPCNSGLLWGGGGGGGGRVKAFYRTTNSFLPDVSGGSGGLGDTGDKSGSLGAAGTVFFNQKPGNVNFSSLNSGSTISFAPVNFTWQSTSDSEGDPISYEYQCSPNANFSTISSNVITTNLSHQWPVFQGISYHRVRAFDGKSFGLWSFPIQIVLDTLPPSNVTVSTANVYITSFTAILSTINDNGIGAHTLPYYLEASAINNFSSIVNSPSWQNSNEWMINNLSPNATYYTRFKVRDAALNETAWSTVTFVTLSNPPSNGSFAAVSPLSIQPQWSSISNPSETAYLVEASSFSNFSVAVSSSPWQFPTSYNFTSLAPNTTYWFRVKARNHQKVETGYVLVGSTPTLAVPPPPPQVIGGFDDSLPFDYFLEVIPEFGENSPETEMAIYSVDGGGYLQGNGTVNQINKVWKSRSQWLAGGNANREILMAPPAGTSYRYRVFARNFGGRETDFLTQAVGILPTTPLTIYQREIFDLDSDGMGETLRLAFSQSIQDSSFTLRDLILDSGLTVSLSTAAGDAANDSVLHLRLSSTLAPDSTPGVKYQGVGLTALSGRRLDAETVFTPASDKVPPVLERTLGASFNNQTVILAVFSESLDSGIALNRAHWNIESPVGTVLPMDAATITYAGGRTVRFSFPIELRNSSSLSVEAINIEDSRHNQRSRSVRTSPSLYKNGHSYSVGFGSNGKRAHGVAVLSSIEVVTDFDREMNAGSLNGGINLVMTADKLGNSVNTSVSGSVSMNAGSSQAKFVPAQLLPKGSKFRVVLSSAVKDIFELSPNVESGWEFYTACDYTEKSVVIPLPGMRVTINPGAFKEDAGIHAVLDPAANARHSDLADIGRAMELERARGAQAGSGSHYPIPNLSFEIAGENTAGSSIRGKLGNSIQLTLAYPDANDDGIVDGTNPGVPAKDLEFYFLNESLGEFRKVAGSSVDTANKTVTATIDHFSIYAVMGKLAPSVAGFLIRPNPWEPYLDPRPMILDNIPDSSEINIYTASTGQKIKTLQSNSQSLIEYDGTNDSGRSLASGVYVAVIKGPGGSKKQKFTIIK